MRDNHNIPPEVKTLMADLSAEEARRLEEVWALSVQDGEMATDKNVAEKDAAEKNAEALQSVWTQIETRMDASGADVSLQPDEEAFLTPLEDAVSGKDAPQKDAAQKEAKIHTFKPGGFSFRDPLPQIVSMRWMAIAATIIFGAIGYAYLFQPEIHMAPLGEKMLVTLHDGSQVELNSGASIQYNKRFSNERRVKLSGEAYFDVKPDEIPFIVETFNASVTVLGTSFNVRAWQDEENTSTQVALESGRVELSGSGQTIEMAPGQTAKVSEVEMSVSDADPEQVQRVLNWRNGKFFYSDELLGNIIKDVERRFNVDITLRPASLSKRRLKFSHEQPVSVEAIIKDLSESQQLTHQKINEGYEIADPARVNNR